MANRRFTLNVTTAADGSYTGYIGPVSGKICAIHYIKTNFADGVDFTITVEGTGETVWTESNVNAAKVCMPRGATHSNAGVAALYASGGVAVNDLIRISRDRIKFVLAQGGNATTGQFQVVLED
jgi:hypothetical protein